MDDDCYCEDWIEPLPCIMNVYNNSFSMNCFNPPMNTGDVIQIVGGSHHTPCEPTNIQLENIDLGTCQQQTNKY